MYTHMQHRYSGSYHFSYTYMWTHNSCYNDIADTVLSDFVPMGFPVYKVYIAICNYINGLYYDIVT